MKESAKLIKQEVDKLIWAAQGSLKEVKRFAIGEVWKILQLLTAAVIRIIENIGKDLSSPEKKKLAMELITDFYDRVFVSIEIPIIPSFVESFFHTYVKKIIMILIDSSIDAMVTTFRELGIFVKSKEKQLFGFDVQAISFDSVILDNFIKNLQKVREKWIFQLKILAQVCAQ